MLSVDYFYRGTLSDEALVTYRGIMRPNIEGSCSCHCKTILHIIRGYRGDGIPPRGWVRGWEGTPKIVGKKMERQVRHESGELFCILNDPKQRDGGEMTLFEKGFRFPGFLRKRRGGETFIDARVFTSFFEFFPRFPQVPYGFALLCERGGIFFGFAAYCLWTHECVAGEFYRLPLHISGLFYQGNISKVESASR